MSSQKTPEDPKKYPHYTMRILFRDTKDFLRPHYGRLATVTFVRVLGEISWLYPAYALSSLVKIMTTYHAGDSLSEVYTVLGLWLFVSIWKRWSEYFSNRYGANAAEKINLAVQQQAVNRLFRLDTSWHERENAGNKLKRIEKGADGLNRLVRIWIFNLIAVLVQLVGILFIVARFDGPLFYATAGYLILYYSISRWFKVRSGRISRIVAQADEEMSGLLFEAINNIRSVRVMSMVPWLSKLINQKTDDMYIKSTERIFWNQAAAYTKNLLAQLFRIGAVAYIIWTIVAGVHDVSFLVLYYGYLTYLWTAVEKIVDVELEIELAQIAVARMMVIFHEPLGVDDERRKKEFPKKWKKIRVENLTFSYHDTVVLDNVSFEVLRGEKIGVMGLSGAGKTTLFKLLLKEHETYTGEIYIDDIPLRKIKKSSYFQYVAAVLQETEVFNISLRDNVAISHLERATDAKLLKRSLEIAHVSDFLHKLPEGVDTTIGEKGVKLSGGERQRVGIARAIFKEPEILFLDEATSHLDVESEERIQDSLHRFFQTVTAIVIAHRLTTIKEMDRIIVLEAGQIIESGPFAELYAKKGRFYDLWEKQKL